MKSWDTEKQNQTKTKKLQTKKTLLKLSDLVCVMKSIWLLMMWTQTDYL